MALEQDIANLIDASNNLTTIVDNKIQSIDARVIKQAQEVEEAMKRLQTIGTGGVGTRAIGVCNYFTAQHGSAFIHLKLPLKLSLHNEMFRLDVTGYAYGEAKPVDSVFVGYCYKNGNGLVNTNCSGSHSPHIYRGSDDHVYCRLTFPTQYFLTLSVDTIRVGNGRLLKHGEIELINSQLELL
ncbi:hypothetical protein ACFFK7_14070 [Pseudoalteromonas xiamenensis]|uniref:hypothetical protein n=1 Tax=Pseudoalteromonas xiamenensis TaxID=882626 RepID=UPI0035E95324